MKITQVAQPADAEHLSKVMDGLAEQAGSAGRYVFDSPTAMLELWEGEELQGFIDSYDGCIAYIDHHLQRVVGALRSKGMLDNTLVVIDVGDAAVVRVDGLLHRAR